MMETQKTHGSPEQESYHKTVEQPEQLTLGYEAKARKQEDVILEIYQGINEDLTASQVYAYCQVYKWPLTSVRRAISNLQERGYLSIQKETKDGIYGRPEHFYKLVKS